MQVVRLYGVLMQDRCSLYYLLHFTGVLASITALEPQDHCLKRFKQGLKLSYQLS